MPVLHTLQPFKYADPHVPIKKSDILEPEVFAKLREHLGVYYSRLRTSAAAQYSTPHSGRAVWYLDLAEALPPRDPYWISWIHASPQGSAIIASRISSYLWATGALQVRDGKTRQ